MMSSFSFILWLAMQAPQPEALYRTAVVSLQAHRYQEAEASFREVYRLEPENIRGLAGIAEVYVAQSRTSEALDLLRAEAEKHPKNAEIHVAIGDVAIRSRQPDTALPEFQEALGLMDVVSAQTALVYLRMGEAYHDKGDSKASLEALRKAAELAPADTTILTNLAMGLDQAGDKKGAMADYRAALTINPNLPVALNNLAFLIADTGGDYYEALRLARIAKEQSPETLEISDTIGWISLKLGWVDEAIERLSDLVRLQPANRSFRDHLMGALDGKRDRSPALKVLRAALQDDATADNQQKILEMLKKP